MFDERYFLKKIGILIKFSEEFQFIPFKKMGVRSSFMALCFLGIFSIFWFYWFNELDRKVLLPIQSLFWTVIIFGAAYILNILFTFKQNNKYGILILGDGLAVGDKEGHLFKFSLIHYKNIESIQIIHSNTFSHKYLKLNLRLDQEVPHWNCGSSIANSPILEEALCNNDLLSLIESRRKINPKT